MSKAITYYRVSTERQGKSGLGLEAQQYAIADFARIYNYKLVKEFIEIESGKKNNRPILYQALDACKKEGATLLIAKLDRLGRNVAFISALMEAGIDFKAIDMPHVDDFVLHIMAAVAEYERKQISARTKAALDAAKKRGVELGAHGKYVLSQTNKDLSKQFALTLQPLISQLQQNGIKTVRGIQAELNRRKVPTYYNNGNSWHLSTVHNVLRHINSQPIQ